MNDISGFKCDYLTQEQIRKKAEIFRKRYWPRNIIPVDAELIAERELGLNIIPQRGISDLLKIDAFLSNDLTSIFVDYRQYADDLDRYSNRLRFSFAHEIGHLILHRKIYQEFTFESIQDYHEMTENLPEDQYSYFEYQANEFAGRLLVPQDYLEIELEKVASVIQKNKELLTIFKADHAMVLENVIQGICKPFGVSEKVIKIRLERESLWPPKL